MAVDPVSLAINAALIAASAAITASQKFEGPRLDSMAVTTADYGAPLNYLQGTRRQDGVSCIWAEPLREVKQHRKTKGGKFNDYTYFGTWAVAVADHEIAGVTRIWFDRNLVYDVTGAGPTSPLPTTEGADELGVGAIAQYITIYLGTDDQDVDPRMAASVDAIHGAGSTPAYRGVAYIVFKDVPLEKLGNRLPQVTVEAYTAGEAHFPVEVREAAYSPAMLNAWGLTYSPDFSRLLFGVDGQYEIWDVRARALMVSGEFYSGEGTIRPNQALWSITNDGSIYQIAGNFVDGHRLLKFYADGAYHRVIGEDEFAFFEYGEHCVALQIGFEDPETALIPPNEYIMIVPYSSQTGGWFYQHGNLDPQPIFHIDEPWQIKCYFKDAYGSIWAAGALGSLDDDVLALYRIFGGGDGPSRGYVTMPVPQDSGIAVVSVFHHLSEGHDHFVVAWNALGNDRMCIVDRMTMMVTDTVTMSVPQNFRGIKPGAQSFWLGTSEISAVDLSIIRTIDYDDWGYPGLTAPTNIYDPLNHAKIVGVDGDLVWMYLDRATGSGVTLRTIVEDVSERAGLTVASDIDATDLTQTVQGYSWTQGSGKAILEPLLEAYDSEARPHDLKVEFLRRGDAVLGTIPVVDMGAGGGSRYTIETALDTDLPLKVNLTFADLDKDQQPNTAIAQRAGAATDSRRELSLDATTLAMDADEARPMADGYLRRSWIKSQTANLALTRAWSKLEPGDAYTLALDDVSRAFKLSRLEFGANGVLTTEWERYAPSVHVASSLAGAPADGLTPGVVPVFGYTKGLVLDIPLVLDTDDATVPLVYLVAAPYSPDIAWPGATFYRSPDGAAYDTELGPVASNQAAPVGYALSALPEALYTVWDRTSTVTVKMFYGELTSATEAEVANGANMALIGDEIVRFTTATLVAENSYQLSGFLRGRRGTEWAVGAHAAGDRFALLSGLPRAAMGASDVGDDVYFRATTSGGPAGFPQLTAPYTGASLKPYAPCHLEVVDDGGDLVATWVRRTRIGGAWRDFQDVALGEGSEAYVVQILDVDGDVIRTYSGLSTPTATYDAADQATDGGAGETLRVMQVSATVGNGFAADVAI